MSKWVGGLVGWWFGGVGEELVALAELVASPDVVGLVGVVVDTGVASINKVGSSVWCGDMVAREGVRCYGGLDTVPTLASPPAPTLVPRRRQPWSMLNGRIYSAALV